ncbi:DegT/DnrJ/EryC1/StrS family aminotransferase [Microbacterium rhizosphaerae]|uniref:DegT/DnrJ/EryC1/StrS family aminotransferase n=1 Tax=Microbacterium rhizosphaerae TaxID=1678237 RepID=A0ABZ0SU49_9MICO|nr:DegT/DnrJ/EryC1/StrS family aminotransferase [Microbacterium rhizosphaerae]WPR91383.1 DegT/DnrJ/EryC1/StrS family aminotransferase [Microbacterium rhizosphaerae]
MIPFYDLQAVIAPHRREIDAAIASVLDNGQTILGPQTAAFETEFAQFCGTRSAVGVGNGLDALSLILRGYGLGIGDEVIVPANTFIATVLAVTANGCTPVLADPDPESMLLNPSTVESLVTPRTRAVIAVHLYGRLCDMDSLSAITRRYGLLLIEDAAQAHGAQRAGRRAGGWGHAAAFSFYPTKNLGGLGDGGAITTDDDDLAARIRMLRNYGSAQKNVHELAGVNSRLDELQAAVLRVRLPHLDTENERRRAIARRYSERLRAAALVLPAEATAGHAFHLYVVRSPERDRVRGAMRAAGVETAVHYPTPPHLQPAYAELAGSSLPIAERLAAEVLSIPLHPAMSDAQVDRVAEVLCGIA